MRCLTLARMLSKSGDSKIYFLTRDKQGSIHSLIRESGFNLILLPETSSCFNTKEFEHSNWLGTSQELDCQEVISELYNIGISEVDLFIIDHYAIGKSWENKIRTIANRLMVIDDLADREHDCDILLDQNLAPQYLTRYSKLVPENCLKYLGIEYCLLREEFFKLRSEIKVRKQLKRIIVFFGGVDNDRLTFKALNVLKNHLDRIEHIDVVVGVNNPFKHEVQTVCSEYSKFCYGEQVDNIAELMALADLSVGACGATNGERIFLGLPSIIVAVAENQKAVAENLAQLELVTYLGFLGNDFENRLERELRELFGNKDLLSCYSSKLLEKSYSDLKEIMAEIQIKNLGNKG